MRFNLLYFLIACGLFCAEVVIATSLSSLTVIRGSIGDFLVVILLYYLVLAFRSIPPARLAAAIFLVACLIEVAQYLQLARLLGLGRNRLLNIVLGTTFSWADIAMYLLGCLAALALQRFVFGPAAERRPALP